MLRPQVEMSCKLAIIESLIKNITTPDYYGRLEDKPYFFRPKLAYWYDYPRTFKAITEIEGDNSGSALGIVTFDLVTREAEY